MTGQSRSAQIERAIREVAELDVVVEDQGGTIVLEGIVGSERDRQAAEDIAADLAGDANIDNALEIQDLLPVSVEAFSDEQRSAELAERAIDFGQSGDDGELNPDFTDQPLVHDPLAAAGPTTGAGDEANADDGDRTYAPPIDPVVTTDAHGQAVVLGGFGTSAMDEVSTGDLAEDQGFGDEAIADAVRRELREDAATTDLQIRVVVRNGVVHLHGRVRDLDDADAAEAVASRLPGVREVKEELTVETAD
jgi:osmotically-inducible protein OsmY